MSDYAPTLELNLHKRMESKIESILRNVIGNDVSLSNPEFMDENDSTDEEKEYAFDLIDYSNILNFEDEKEDSPNHHSQTNIQQNALSKEDNSEQTSTFIPTKQQKCLTQVLHKPPELIQTYFQELPVSSNMQYYNTTTTNPQQQSSSCSKIRFGSSNFTTTFNRKQKQIQQPSNFVVNNAYWTHLEYLLNKTKKIDKFIYSQISGNIHNILSSQQGCKIFHNYFHNTNHKILNYIFIEISEHLLTLLPLPHTHYALIKFYDSISLNNKLFFLNIIKNNFLLLSTHNISTYFIQNLIEKLSTSEEKQIIIKTIHKFLLELSLNKYGTHVICKIILFFEYQYITSIISFVINNFMLLSLDGNGLCIVKKVVALENSTQTMYYLIIKDILMKNADTLIQSPYGNYVLQVSLDSWTNFNDIEKLIFCFLTSVISFSLQKFSSNVIEKSFEKSNAFLSQFITYLSYEQSGDLRKLLSNNFGFYVLQKAFQICNPSEFQLLLALVNNELKHSTDKKMLMKWYKFCKQNNFQ